jgi:hypothetical protein
MKTIFILSFILLLLSFHSNAQQTIDKLNVNQLKLPKESANKALILDVAGQVKSSSTISDTELGYLEGLNDTLLNLLSGKEPSITSGTTSQYYRGDKTFQTLDKSAVGLSNVDNTSDANKPISSATQTALNLKANDNAVVKLTGNQSISGVKTFTGKIVASTTINGSIPCPVMTQTQRDAFTASQGDCVYNTTSLQLNIYDGTVWKSAGGSGGISLWLTGTSYAVNDVVINSDKIYRCLIAHTSGTFATDLGAGRWTEVSASPSTPYSLANGGTNKALTAVNGGIVWVDADSFEILSAGVSGQILQSNGAAAPSFVNKSISAKSLYGSSFTAEEIQVPNNQLTQVDTNKHLNETGNKNILINPSFEHSTFSTGWTNSAGTFTQDTVVEIDGLKAAKLVLSSQTMSLSQSSTLYASQFADGVQGLASVRVKSDVALKVCSIQAGTVSTSNCVDVVANNKWGLYKVPMILGATSNGISIASSGAVSGTVYIDDSFVGAVDLQANTNNVSTWLSYTPTITNGSGAITNFTSSAQYRRVGDTLEVSGLIKFSAASGAFSEINVAVPSGLIIDTTKLNSSVSLDTNIGDGSIYDSAILLVPAKVYYNNSTTLVQLRYLSSTSGTNPVNVSAGQIISNTLPFTFGTSDSISYNFKVPIVGWSSSGSVYSSTNADTDWASCGHAPADFTGFGTVSAIETQCKRQGGDLLMKGKFTAGTPTAVEARVALPIWNGVQLVSAGSSVIPSLQYAANAYRNVNSTTYFSSGVLMEPSVSYLTFGTQADTLSITTKLTGSGFISAGNILSFNNVRIPIAGWQQSNIIIGQFNGLESCTDTLECTDTFSAKVSSAGVVSDENVNWISGNCTSSAGAFTCTYASGIFTVAPNCSMTAISVADSGDTRAGITSTNFSVQQTNTSNVGRSDGFWVVCQKSGPDYVAKSAKAVASDQNVRSIGAVGVDMQQVFVGSGANCTSACTTGNCTICRNVGSKITSVSFVSTGQYNLNGIDGTKYSCIGNASEPGVTYTTMFQDVPLSTSTFVRIQNAKPSNGTTVNGGSMNIFCIGIP